MPTPGQFIFDTMTKTWMELIEVTDEAVRVLRYHDRDPRMSRRSTLLRSRFTRMLEQGRLRPVP